MVLITAKDVYNEIDVLPSCLAELVAQYTRSSDEAFILEIIQWHLKAKVFQCEEVKLEISWYITGSLVSCAYTFKTFHEYKPQYFFLRADSFFRDFKDFIKAQTDPIKLKMFKEVYDFVFAIFSTLTK